MLKSNLTSKTFESATQTSKLRKTTSMFFYPFAGSGRGRGSRCTTTPTDALEDSGAPKIGGYDVLRHQAMYQ